MKIKKLIITSLLFGAAYASTANAALICESFPTSSYCENNTQPIAPGNSYSWQASGVLYMQSGNTYIGRVGCNAQGSGTVTSTVTFTDGSTNTQSKTLYCAAHTGNPIGGGGGQQH